MIFGDPYRFAIWIECIPQWSESYKNGFFYFFIDGHMYPEDIRTSTLFVDIYDVIDEKNALLSFPCNDEIFKATTTEAFNSLFKLTYPESTQDDEYPEQVFDFCASPTIINDSGAYFFAIANESSVRIVGGKITELVSGDNGRTWVDIEQPNLEDITIPKKEISEIIASLKKYSSDLL
ncbi:immunity 42 family protein [Pantoea agglomerans]|uniref:immunity 42 family protein n=1 Tax=Enterobacter agglomerans TaxID=549 RepID=UPI001654940E|nr:immunity 42 family protein [Pantoea agglomerans]